MTLTVPVVDLSAAADPDGRAAVAAAIDDALRDVGFMAVVGHGIDPALTDRMFATVAELFAQPLAVKLAASPSDPGGPRGYSSLGTTAQANAHEDATTTDLVETFNAGLEPIPDTAYFRANARHFTPNVWPASPAELPVVWGAYRRAMQDLADRIMSLMATALGLDAGFFVPLLDRPMASITANHYPALDHEPAGGQLRGGAHTDYGTITLLATDGVPGLQLRDHDGSWSATEPVPGALHVNTGDMMQHWTGGRWRSTWHRVVPPPGGPPYRERTSLAYFHSPNADAVVAPLPGVPATPATSTPITAGTYLREKIARYHAPRAAGA